MPEAVGVVGSERVALFDEGVQVVLGIDGPPRAIRGEATRRHRRRLARAASTYRLRRPPFRRPREVQVLIARVVANVAVHPEIGIAAGDIAPDRCGLARSASYCARLEAESALGRMSMACGVLRPSSQSAACWPKAKANTGEFRLMLACRARRA